MRRPPSGHGKANLKVVRKSSSPKGNSTANEDQTSSFSGFANNNLTKYETHKAPHNG